MRTKLQITDTNVSAGCECNTAESTAPATSASSTLTLQVTGISCGGCAARVTEALNVLPRVGDIQIELNPGSPATVSISGDVDPEIVRRTIMDISYTILT